MVTHSPEHTERVGCVLAALLPAGAVVALRGALATGKTCLVRGMATHFDPKAPVHSPTFTLVNQYGGPRRLYHLDLYRLSGPADLVDLGYEELFEPDGVCVVEWAERAEALLPPRRMDVFLEHVGEESRRLVFVDLTGMLPEGWRDALQQA